MVFCISSGECVAEWHAGPQLWRALCEEDSGKAAGGRGAEKVEQSAAVVGRTVFHSRKQNRYSLTAL